MFALVIVLLGKAESGIFDGIRAKLSDWTAPILESVRDPLSGMQKWVGNAGDIFEVYEENIRLKRQIAELQKLQEQVRAQKETIHRYEILLNAVPDAELPSVQARVIGQSSRPFIKTMILNAGAAQNVKAGQAVVDDRGLIGRIYLTGDRSSWVILLTDLNSHVPVMVEPSNRRAMLSGDNSSSPSLDLDAGLTPIHAGDRVYSSGDGEQLPPGLPVGTVVDEGGSYRVSLFSDGNEADYVHVIDYQVPALPPPGSVGPQMPAAPPQAAPTQAATPAPTAATTPATTTAQANTPAPAHKPPHPAHTATATPPAPSPSPAPEPETHERATPDNSPGAEPDQ